MSKKICGRCKVEKEYACFNNDKSRKSGLSSYCKECTKNYSKKRYDENPEFFSEYQKKYRELNPEKYKEKKKKENLKRKAKYHSDPEYKQAIIDNSRKWHKENKEHIREYYRKKYSVESSDNVARKMRSRICMSMKYSATFKPETEEIVGCTLDEFRNHIESQFRDGMSWENYGEWELDHIKPCKEFNLLNENEVKECFHYSNVQPLWKIENIQKRFGYRDESGNLI